MRWVALATLLAAGGNLPRSCLEYTGEHDALLTLEELRDDAISAFRSVL